MPYYSVPAIEVDGTKVPDFGGKPPQSGWSGSYHWQDETYVIETEDTLPHLTKVTKAQRDSHIKKVQKLHEEVGPTPVPDEIFEREPNFVDDDPQ